MEGRVIRVPMHVPTVFCPSCSLVMYSVCSKNSQYVYCVNAECELHGTEFQVNPPQLELKEIV